MAKKAAAKSTLPDGMGMIVIPALNIKTLHIKLEGQTHGDNPRAQKLVCHAWSEKARKQIADREQHKATNAKEARDPWEEYVDAFYWMSPKPANRPTEKDVKTAKFGFPAIGFKAAAVTACTSLTTVTKVFARQAFHVLGDEHDLVPIFGTPEMREDMVRVGMGSATLRYRPEFKNWHTVLAVEYNASVISPEQLLHLFNTAGFAVGVGEGRAEKDGGWGRFRVAHDQKV